MNSDTSKRQSCTKRSLPGLVPAGSALALLVAACSGTQPYTSPVPTSAGTTFDCVRGQLVQMGYGIDEADRDRGVVIGRLPTGGTGAEESASVLSAEIDGIDSSSKLSIRPYRETIRSNGDVDRDSDAATEADARSLLVRCGGRVDQGEPDRPYGVRPEITTTP